MKRPLFNLNDPATMARVRQTLREDEQSEGSNIIVAPRGPTANARDHGNDHAQPKAPSVPSTRIRETPIIPATAPAPAAAPAARRPNNDVDSLRIRNAIQREELRSSALHLRRAYERMGEMEEEATTHREQLLNYREVHREQTLWMEGSMLVAMVLAICVLLYIGWCFLNSAEFEYQEKVLRRNLKLD